MESSSRYNLVHILSTSLSKSGLNASAFYDLKWSTTSWRCGWHMQLSSCYSLVHMLSTSLSKSGLTPSVFSRLVCETELSLQPHAHLVDLIFKKCSEIVNLFVRFLCEFELSLQPHAYFVDRFPWSRRAPAETETLQQRPRSATLPQKNTGFCAQECFKREFTLPIAHSSQLLDDDMVDMMMWFPWCWDR